MAAVQFEDIQKDIRNKILYPVYFLMGDEGFYIDGISDHLEEHVLTGEEKEFNLSILYGKETDIQTIISTAKRFPMMASHHLVIVKEAQNIRNIEDLLAYVQKPLQSTILVICYKYKSLDRRTKFVKELGKTGLVFEGRKLYDNQVPDWISKHVKGKGYRIGPKAVQMLADHLGSDLGKIVNELSKVFINLKKGDEITTSHIEANIGISKDFNVFELQNALGEGNRLKAFQIVRYFADNPKANPMVKSLGILYQFFSKVLIYHSLRDKSRNNVASALSVNPFFVPDYQTAARNYSPKKLIRIFSILREYDLKSKGVGNVSFGEGELMKEMTYKLLQQ
ncbi:MAG: DNA polymerase III subunit delta [Bacteroidales bacterium]